MPNEKEREEERRKEDKIKNDLLKKAIKIIEGNHNLEALANIDAKLNKLDANDQKIELAIAEIKKDLTYGEERFTLHDKRITSIENILSSHPFINMLDDSKRHHGDLLKLFNIFSSEYGYENKTPGYELLPKIMDKCSGSMENGHTLKNEGLKRIVIIIASIVGAVILFVSGTGFHKTIEIIEKLVE